jgi:hypothetical protein
MGGIKPKVNNSGLQQNSALEQQSSGLQKQAHLAKEEQERANENVALGEFKKPKRTGRRGLLGGMGNEMGVM